MICGVNPFILVVSADWGNRKPYRVGTKSNYLKMKKLFEKSQISKLAEHTLVGGRSDTGTTSHWDETYTHGCSPQKGTCKDDVNNDLYGDWDDRDLSCE